MPSPDVMADVLTRYAETFARRDLEGLVALFTEDAVQADPANVAPNVGHEAIATFFANAFAASTASTWRARSLHPCGEHVGANFTVSVTMEGGSMVIEGVEVFTFAEDGRIRAVSAYWGDGDVTFTPA